MRYDDAPPLVIWETSQASDPACSNCQVSATPRRHSSDLSTEEGVRLLEEVRAFGHPLMVFTGGDPLKRPDLFTMIRKSVALGLRTNIMVSATPLLTPWVVEQLKDAGIDRMAIGLDGWNLDSHGDSFDCTMAALDAARKVGLDTQVHTPLTAINRSHLDEIAELVEGVNARTWSLALEGDEFETTFHNIYGISKRSSFEVKTEDARYRNFLHRRLRMLGDVEGPDMLAAERGRGFVFVSHTGEIHPSGFLPVSAGNIRYDSLVEVYRNSSLFSLVRNNHSVRETTAKAHHAKYAEVLGLALML